MAETWQERTLDALTLAACAFEDADAAGRAQLQRQLRPPLRTIKGVYADAKAGDSGARYQLIDSAVEVHAIIRDIIGPHWTPSNGTLAAKLRGIGVTVAP